MPWVKWEVLAVPKILGGWGLNNIHLFSKALAAKFSRRLISIESLWKKLVYHKYIFPDSIEEWIRRPIKELLNCSVIWKSLTKYFSVVGEGLAWQVGNGTRVIIHLYPLMDSGRSHLLPQELINNLNQLWDFPTSANCRSS
jgi:hypothetical protein